MTISGLSLFFPFYNEEKKVEEAIRLAYQVLLTLDLEEYEVFAVDDGSKDETGAILDQLKSKDYPDLAVIHHFPNRGYGGALKSGFLNSHFEWVCFTDGDLQFDLNEIANFLERAQKGDCDLVVGRYLFRSVPLFRRVNTLFWGILVKLLFSIKVKDIDCGFKLIKKEVIEKVSPLESNGAFLSTELLVKAQKAGFRIVEVPVHHYPDLAGGSTGANPKVVIKAFVDLFRLWRKLR